MEIRMAGGWLQLQHPIMNGAGWGCKSLDDVKVLASIPVSAIVVGSITLEESLGNTGNVYWSDPEELYSLNSLGLPNRGWPYYRENLKEMCQIAKDAGKPLIASIACFSPEEYAALARSVAAYDVDMVELNLGCPNVWGKGGQKPIASYEPKLVKRILAQVKSVMSPFPVPVSVKISPVPPIILREVAEVIAESQLATMVVATNTLPNGFAWNGTKPAVDPGDGLAGIAGRALKPLSLGVVRQLHDLLPPTIDIVGVGGIRSGRDVLDYLHAGAKAVQIVTAHANHGPMVFGRILTEFVSLKEKEAVAS